MKIRIGRVVKGVPFEHPALSNGTKTAQIANKTREIPDANFDFDFANCAAPSAHGRV
jgi:hypothetical protein